MASVEEGGADQKNMEAGTTTDGSTNLVVPRVSLLLPHPPSLSLPRS